MIRFGHRWIGVATMSALLLTGCTGPDMARPPQSVRPTASATPAAATAPEVRVPLGCDDLATATELAAGTTTALTGVAPFVAVAASLERFADLQYGALDCAWSTQPLALDLAAPLVLITVVPDVTPERWAQFTSLLPGSGSERGVFGGDSYVACSPSRFDGSVCELNNLIGGYWLSVLVSTPDGSLSPDAAAPLFDRATAAVRSAAPSAQRWVSPSAASARVSELDIATAQAALGASSLEYVVDGVSPQNGARWLPSAETGLTRGFYVASGLQNGTSVEFAVDVLPSGAWAFEAGPFAALTQPVDGVGDAAMRYGSGSGSTVVFTLDDDLVLVDVSSGTLATGPDEATAIAKAVAAALA